MKRIVWILFLVSTLNFVRANDIDNLKTKAEVENFLVQKVDTAWSKHNFFESMNDKDTSSFGKGKFLKLDLDNNGLTDLVINGRYFFAVTDDGNGHYASHFIDRGSFMLDKHALKNIVYKNKIPLLVVAKYNEYSREIDANSKADTLILVYGGFYEFNSAPDNFKIDEIRFSTSPCYGTCPVFDLTIKGDRRASYNAKQYNEREGEFKTTIDSISYHKLVQTINYIKLTTLKDQYSVNWSDDQTVTLEIKFNNGQTKKISDYGEIGTFGLEHLYEKLFSMPKTQKWKNKKSNH